MRNVLWSESKIWGVELKVVDGVVLAKSKDVLRAWGIDGKLPEWSNQEELRELVDSFVTRYDDARSKRMKYWIESNLDMVSQSGMDASYKRILQAIKAAGGEGVSLSGMQRYTQGMPSIERARALDLLVDDGLIRREIVRTGTKGRHKHIFYIA